MKKKINYETPSAQIFEMENDIIVTSQGIETSPEDDNDGIWELDL